MTLCQILSSRLQNLSKSLAVSSCNSTLHLKWHYKQALYTATASSYLYLSLYPSSPISWLTSSPARRFLPLPPRHAHRTYHNRTKYPQRFPNSRLHLPNQALDPPSHRHQSLLYLRQILRATPSRKRKAGLDHAPSKPGLRLARPRENNHSDRYKRC
jgi:hypothetical protein